MSVARRTIAALTLCACTAPAAAQWTAYVLPHDGTSSVADGIKDGIVFGYVSGGPTPPSPVLWDVITRTPTNMRPTDAGANALPSGQTVNQVEYARIHGGGDGQFVGIVLTSGLNGPTVWNGGANTITMLNARYGANGVAWDAEANMQVGQYGFAFTSVKRPSLWMGEAYSRIDLLPPGVREGVAYALDQGVVSGALFTATNVHAALWPLPLTQPQTWIDLTPASSTDAIIVAAEDGVQVGSAYFSVLPSQRAAMWRGTPETFVDLGALFGGSSEVRGTDGVWQAGASSDRWTALATIWRGTAASWIRLHEYLPELPGGMATGSIATGVWSDGTMLYVSGYAAGGGYGSETAVLWVGPVCEPPAILSQPQPVAFCSGQTLTLSVAVDAVQATYQWYRNGVALYGPASAREATLSIPWAWTADAGEYTCEVRTDCGGVVTQPVTVRYVQFCCNDIDFNNNDVFPEEQDVIDFFAAVAGDTTCLTCDPIDFNNNGVFPEDQDVIDFFNVLAGGTCP
jgi:hypothetical protein